MHRRVPTALAAALVLLPAAPAAAALRPQPLVDVPPQTTSFRDQVGPEPARARAAGASRPTAYETTDGQTVSVQFSGSYTPDPQVAQTYVDFLGSLPHGRELSRLKMYIATPREVVQDCGGISGTLACYDPATNRMTVPGEQTAENSDGVTTSYVIAHEYGHHIARWRSNAPFGALAFGPKRWASYELVCLNTIKGRLAPGDEAERYLENPGEAWADTYAHLKYPGTFWQFTPLLRPNEASKAAALRDVLAPWTTRRRLTFTGGFAPGDPRTRAFHFVLRLDGSLRVRLHGPRGANYDLALRSLGRQRGTTKGPTASDTYSTQYACREVQSENVTLDVVRRSGFGAFTVTVDYAG